MAKKPTYKDLQRRITELEEEAARRKTVVDAEGESETRFREMADMLPQVVFETDLHGNLTYMNRFGLEYSGYSSEDLGKGLNVLQLMIAGDRDRATYAMRGVLQGNRPDVDRRYRALKRNGESFPAMVFSSPIVRAGVAVGLRGILVDMTEHEKWEEEKKRLQDQLYQAQKMESVGRLAGGVAHDFNNKLGVILGCTELVMEKMDPEDPLYRDLQETHSAATYSANLVRQLLAFARKQIVKPKVLDLNATVSDMLEMLRRLIGENIELSWVPGRELWPVRIDPSQVDQILANLAVNARDAISVGGKVTVETENVTLLKPPCEDPEFSPGSYVVLAVRDNGKGMSKEILRHLFEPFFTTKGIGKGTGLGLSTIYGIVKQNHGFIQVWSKPDEGTTFRIHLPKHEEEIAPRKIGMKEIVTGSETVLLVEDEESFMNVAKRVLEGYGYTVLAAETPSEALSLMEKCPGEIHLVVSDVVMPEMDGPDLMKRLRVLRPHFKCLYMSGYTASIVDSHEAIHYIQKPFSLRALAEKVREVLDSPNS